MTVSLFRYVITYKHLLLSAYQTGAKKENPPFYGHFARAPGKNDG